LTHDGAVNNRKFQDCEHFIEDYTITQLYGYYYFRVIAKTAKGKIMVGILLKYITSKPAQLH
jgi:hypothetical protein